MTAEYARMEWDRALEAFRSARLLVAHGGFDSAASRAYYAAFHGVTALFALEERVFTKHSALEAAVHRDLVKAGRWSTDLGRDYSFCAEARGVGDYGPTFGWTRARRPKRSRHPSGFSRPFTPRYRSAFLRCPIDATLHVDYLQLTMRDLIEQSDPL